MLSPVQVDTVQHIACGVFRTVVDRSQEITLHGAEFVRFKTFRIRNFVTDSSV